VFRDPALISLPVRFNLSHWAWSASCKSRPAPRGDNSN